MQIDTQGSRAEGARTLWERPRLRRLAANRAENGPLPCNDGQGGGGCGNDNHSGKNL